MRLYKSINLLGYSCCTKYNARKMIIYTYIYMYVSMYILFNKFK